MPYVNVRILDDGVTTEQKRQVVAGMTSVLVDVLGKNPASCHIVIDEVSLDNWGLAGESVAARRQREADGR